MKKEEIISSTSLLALAHPIRRRLVVHLNRRERVVSGLD